MIADSIANACQLITYHTSPRQVVVIDSALVERDEEVGAGVAVGEGKLCGGHFFAGGFCNRHHSSAGALSSLCALPRLGMGVLKGVVGLEQGWYRVRVFGPPSPRPTASLIVSVTVMLSYCPLRRKRSVQWPLLLGGEVAEDSLGS